jgi:hypothetical protein
LDKAFDRDRGDPVGVLGSAVGGEDRLFEDGKR